MSTRTNLRPTQVIPSPQSAPTNGSMAGNITSAPTILQSITKPNYALSWVGVAPVGTVSVQASNDYSLNPDGTVHNAGTWNTLTLVVNGAFVTTVPISGNTGNGMIDIESLGAYAVRLIYTFTSGTGTLTAILNGKVS